MSSSRFTLHGSSSWPGSYLMPWLLGYSVLGMLSFPLEGEAAKLIWKLFTPGW